LGQKARERTERNPRDPEWVLIQRVNSSIAVKKRQSDLPSIPFNASMRELIKTLVRCGCEEGPGGADEQSLAAWHLRC
jgi:hypothetical protein